MFLHYLPDHPPQISFKVLECTFSGCRIDPRSVTLFPSTKCKTTISENCWQLMYTLHHSSSCFPPQLLTNPALAHCAHCSCDYRVMWFLTQAHLHVLTCPLYTHIPMCLCVLQSCSASSVYLCRLRIFK